VEEARVPVKPIKPNKKMNMMISIVLGLGLGIGAALLLHSLDSKIRTFDDVKKNVALPILGTIPYIHIYDSDLDQIENMIRRSKDKEKEELLTLKHHMETKLITDYSPKSSAAEAFRILRTNIIARKKNTDSLSILITSSGPKEGKSTIHANLATALAQMDAKVILVDVDLRRPMVHTIFDFEKENGISDFLIDKSSNIENIIKNTSVPNLDIITSGYIPPNPSELLASPRMDKLLVQLKESYDYVLLDSPPVIAVTDSTYEYEGTLEWPGRFDFTALMSGGTWEYLPIFEGTVRSIVYPELEIKSEALLISRKHIATFTHGLRKSGD